MSQKFDLTVIGSGPAGYVAAIRAAQLGMKVAIVEKYSTLGGTCLNVGCIPSKALLSSSEKYEALGHDFAKHGISVTGAKLDVKKMVKRKQEVVTKLTGGIDYLMKKNKITRFEGWATLTDANTISVAGKKSQNISSDKILLAVGSKSVELPFAKFDGKTVISSTEALELTKVPTHMIIVGAGVIGVEMGSVWRRLGAKVTLVDVAERPVAIMDKDLGDEALKIFTQQGLSFELGAKVENIKVAKDGKATVKITGGDGVPKTLKGDKVLVCVGRRANTANLGLDKVGVKVDERGVIQINGNMQTNIPSIYAVGDCVPGPMLAHKGEEEGIACVEKIAGKAGHVNHDIMPSVVYTTPEIAGVGVTEEEAKEAKISYKSAKFPFMANGRAIAIDEEAGFVKVIADKETDKLLGVHIIGHNASEMISEAVIAMEFGASSEDVARSVHAHPTMSEALKEACLGIDGRIING